MTWYEDRATAELAEAEAIDSEHPAHNVQTHSALLGKNAHIQRQALKVDVPADLHLRHRMHQYRLDHGMTCEISSRWLSTSGSATGVLSVAPRGRYYDVSTLALVLDLADNYPIGSARR